MKPRTWSGRRSDRELKTEEISKLSQQKQILQGYLFITFYKTFNKTKLFERITVMHCHQQFQLSSFVHATTHVFFFCYLNGFANKPLMSR